MKKISMLLVFFFVFCTYAHADAVVEAKIGDVYYWNLQTLGPELEYSNSDQFESEQYTSLVDGQSYVMMKLWIEPEPGMNLEEVYVTVIEEWILKHDCAYFSSADDYDNFIIRNYLNLSFNNDGLPVFPEASGLWLVYSVFDCYPEESFHMKRWDEDYGRRCQYGNGIHDI